MCPCLAVYSTTASNSHESSYACYYDEKRETYLGDWYSVNWMEDSDVVGDVSPAVSIIYCSKIIGTLKSQFVILCYLMTD